MRKRQLFFAVFAMARLGGVEAAASQDSKTVQWTIEKKSAPITPNYMRDTGLIRRDKTLLQQIDNKGFLFYANVSLGTPPQHFHLHVDTGSSDTWVQSPRSQICTSKTPSPCDLIGSFDNTTSSTYEYVNSDFSIKYMDGGVATGDYGKDTFYIGGATIGGLQFGYGLQSDVREGIMGLGFRMNEAQVQNGHGKPYDNLPYLLAKQGYINSVAYSIWLNDLSSSTGEILFGGIDTEKYHGDLFTLPIDKRKGAKEAAQFIITMTGLWFVNEGGQHTVIQGKGDPDMGVLLDTGASFTYLPDPMAEKLAALAGATMNEKARGPTLPCNWRFKYPDSVLNFVFSGVNIKVPLEELIVNCFNQDGSPCMDPSGNRMCYFGVLKAGPTMPSLGDTFLRSVYVVYDLDNEEISIAPTFYNSTKSNIVEIGSGKDSVPNASGVTSAASIIATATQGAGVIVNPTQTGAGGTVGVAGGTAAPTSTHSAMLPSEATQRFNNSSVIYWITCILASSLLSYL